MHTRSLGIRAAATAVVAVPLTLLLGDAFRLHAERGTTGDGTDTVSVVSQLAAIDAHRGAFETASWLFYLAMVLSIPMLVVLWRLAVDRSPRWAWAGAVLGVCWTLGQVAHLMGYFASTQALSSMSDTSAAAAAHLTVNENPFAFAVFAPYLLGVLLALPVQAVALHRARVIPRWAMLLVVLASRSMQRRRGHCGRPQSGPRPWSSASGRRCGTSCGPRALPRRPSLLTRSPEPPAADFRARGSRCMPARR